MAGVSIIIPSKHERFIWKTAEDVFRKATGEIEVLVGLDGYEEAPPTQYLRDLADTGRLCIYSMPPSPSNQKRQVVNMGAALARGDYLMSLDAHCMMAEGFDEVLARDHQPNWVQVPRRHRLDAENWCLQEQYVKPPIDYEYIVWEPMTRQTGFLSFRWDERSRRLKDVPLGKNMTMQGSCWFMAKRWFENCGFMQTVGYGGWGSEGEEVSFSTYRAGGQLMTNKNTWCAHLHKGRRWGRGYDMKWEEVRRGERYAFNLWVKERRAWFESFIEKWMPIPGWPADWQRLVYGEVASC